jgi:serine/threonine-protein kinase
MQPAESESLPGPGAIIAGKYRVIRVIGRGGMGVVYEAEHQRLGQRFAIKMLNAETRRVPELAARFEREARAAAKLKGPNVVRVSDVESDAFGSPFMVMELLEGCNLDDLLESRGRLQVAEAVDYILQACSAMVEAHAARIIHRDLKPGNLFLAQANGTQVLKVLDFGISKLEGDAAVTLTSSALGTPVYMSPEQIRSARRVDERSDIWSLGVILYEMVTGTRPFNGENPTAVIASITADPPIPASLVNPALPAGFSDAIMRALDKAPANRYQSVQEFAAALAPFADSTGFRPMPSARRLPLGLRSSLDIATAPTEQRLPGMTQSSVPTVTLEQNAGPKPRSSIKRFVGLGVLCFGGVMVAVSMLGRETTTPVVASSKAATLEAPRVASSSVAVAGASAGALRASASAPVPSANKAALDQQRLDAGEPADRPVAPSTKRTLQREAQKARPKPAETASDSVPARPTAPAQNPIHL